jgi:Ca-activated chloride channel family protein
VRYPVMSNLEFSFRGAEVFALSPNHLPDLFKGGQIILAGRYRDAGRTTLVLRGQAGNERQEFHYDFTFPERERERDFVARLWATRRVGDLLDEIRLHGENSELKNEVIALAKEFGLVTPYTSYLVQEEEMVTLRERVQPQGVIMMAPGQGEALHRAAAAPTMDAMQQTSGAGAVQMSKSIRAMKSAEVASESKVAGLIVVKGRTLRRHADGSWMDIDNKNGTETIRLVFASEAYFTFLRVFPEARDFCKLGNKLIFKFRGKFVQIGDSGEKQMSEAQLREMFK